MKNNLVPSVYLNSRHEYTFLYFTDKDFNERIIAFAKNNPDEWAKIWPKFQQDNGETYSLEEWLASYDEYDCCCLDHKYFYLEDYFMAHANDFSNDRLNKVLGLTRLPSMKFH